MQADGGFLGAALFGRTGDGLTIQCSLRSLDSRGGCPYMIFIDYRLLMHRMRLPRQPDSVVYNRRL